MQPLKTLLAINGFVFLVRAYLNLFRPTSFYLEPDAPKNAVDAVRVIGVTYGALGLIQLGMWPVADRRAVRAVSRASSLFAAGITVQALIQGSESSDSFHQMRFASAAENALVAGLYAVLLHREAPPTKA